MPCRHLSINGLYRNRETQRQPPGAISRLQQTDTVFLYHGRTHVLPVLPQRRRLCPDLTASPKRIKALNADWRRKVVLQSMRC
jgi:hypothetical protein